MSLHTFRATFGGRLTCTVTFDPAMEARGEHGYGPPTKQWSPQPSEEEFDAFFPEYRDWIHTVYGQIAHLINEPYRAVLQNLRAQPLRWEAWIYHPDGRRECVAKGTGAFKPPPEE